MKHWTKMGFISSEKRNIESSERILSVLAGSWLLYKSIKNIRRHPYVGIQGAGAGGLLLYRGATGICPVNQTLEKYAESSHIISVNEEITINAPVSAVYAFWKDLSNLPKFMKHLKSVEKVNHRISHWTANILGGLIKINWDTKIIKEEPDKYLSWKSLEGSMIDTTGKVEFRKDSEGGGTVLQIEINYLPPEGKIGTGIASMFSHKFEQMLREDIQEFRAYTEGDDFKQYSDQVNDKESTDSTVSPDSRNQS